MAGSSRKCLPGSEQRSTADAEPEVVRPEGAPEAAGCCSADCEGDIAGRQTERSVVLPLAGQ